MSGNGPGGAPDAVGAEDAGRTRSAGPSPDPARAADPPRPERVRVTAPRAGEPLTPLTPLIPSGTTPGSPASAERVLVASLIRSQLRVAIVCALGFAAALAAVAFVAALPVLNEQTIAGVPVGWLVLAFGAYPPLVAIAALAVTAANRAEDQYRALTDRDGEDA